MLTDAIRSERRAFAETLRAVGPEAPSLIDGWTAHDVAAHVVSLDRFGGVPTFLGRTLVSRGLRLNDVAGRFSATGFASLKRRGFEWAVDRLVQEPPRLLVRGSVAAIGLFEVFVHHEDVRRPSRPEGHRDAPPAITETIPWLLRYHRRRIPADVRLVVRSAGSEWQRGSGREAILEGSSGDVVLWLAGRQDASTAELTGGAADDLRRAALRI